MKHQSAIWGSQETAVAFLRGDNGTVYRHKTLPIVAVIRERAGRVTFALWHGKAGKPAFHFTAPTLEKALGYCRYYWDRLETNLGAKAQRVAEQAAKRATLKASFFWTVGDVIYNSWGYEQTNVDWYQVTGVDAKSIRIRPIASNARDTAHMSGICQPARFKFTGEEVRKTIRVDGHITFRHGGASKWDGRPVHYSYYH